MFRLGSIPRFAYILSSFDTLSTLFALCSFTFCPGLFELLSASTTPTLCWIKSLPTDVPKNVWGVYVVVLEKLNHPPLLYAGSATAAYRGARARFHEYDSNATTVAGAVKKSITRWLQDHLQSIAGPLSHTFYGGNSEASNCSGRYGSCFQLPFLGYDVSRKALQFSRHLSLAARLI